MKQKGINNKWKDVVRTVLTHKRVTINLTHEFEQPIIIRQCSEPIDAVSEICEVLKYKHKPFIRKKAVVARRNLKK